jgi:hypothetical protein
LRVIVLFCDAGSDAFLINSQELFDMEDSTRDSGRRTEAPVGRLAGRTAIITGASRGIGAKPSPWNLPDRDAR